MDFDSLLGLGIGPLKGDIDGLDVFNSDIGFSDSVYLVDNLRSGDRGHKELGSLRQGAFGSRHVDGHAVSVFGSEVFGRVLDLFFLLLLFGFLVVGLVLVVGLILLVSVFLILVVGVGTGFVALVA